MNWIIYERVRCNNEVWSYVSKIKIVNLDLLSESFLADVGTTTVRTTAAAKTIAITH